MKWGVLFLLALAVFVSAIKVVALQHQSRSLFVEVQQLEKKRDQLNEEWSRLQLEQSTWATHDRIEDVARTKMGMYSPDMTSIVLLVQ